jgi:hypothetical protein
MRVVSAAEDWTFQPALDACNGSSSFQPPSRAKSLYPRPENWSLNFLFALYGGSWC